MHWENKQGLKDFCQGTIHIIIGSRSLESHLLEHWKHIDGSMEFFRLRAILKICLPGNTSQTFGRQENSKRCLILQAGSDLESAQLQQSLSAESLVMLASPKDCDFWLLTSGYMVFPCFALNQLAFG